MVPAADAVAMETNDKTPAEFCRHHHHRHHRHHRIRRRCRRLHNLY